MSKCDVQDLLAYVLGAVTFVLATVSSVVGFCARRLQTSNVDLLVNWTRSQAELAASNTSNVSLRPDLNASLAREERTAIAMETTLDRGAASYTTACSHASAAAGLNRQASLDSASAFAPSTSSTMVALA